MNFYHNGPAVLMNDGNVLVIDGDTKQAEINAFPNGKYDDQVDALMQLIDSVKTNQYDCSLQNIAEAIKRRKQRESSIWSFFLLRKINNSLIEASNAVANFARVLKLGDFPIFLFYQYKKCPILQVPKVYSYSDF